MNMSSTTQRIGLATTGAALVLLVAWYFLVWSPQGHKLAAARKEHASAVAQVGQLHTQISSLQALERQISTDKAKLTEYTANIPDTPQLASALHQIQAVATSSGVTMSSISPSGPPAATNGTANEEKLNGVPYLGFSISATGTYPQLMTFLTALDSMQRTLVVNSLALSGGSGGSHSLSASISSDVFYAGQSTP